MSSNWTANIHCISKVKYTLKVVPKASLFLNKTNFFFCLRCIKLNRFKRGFSLKLISPCRMWCMQKICRPSNFGTVLATKSRSMLKAKRVGNGPKLKEMTERNEARALGYCLEDKHVRIIRIEKKTV